MNFLRIFGEQIGIFASSGPAHIQFTPSDESGLLPPQARESYAPPAPIETEIPHCCFECSHCNSLILLPHDGLGYAFGGPAIRKIETRAIGTACPACGHVGVYSLFRGCPGYTTRHKFAPAPAAGRTMLLDWLPCEEETCVFPLPFFVTFDDAITEETVRRFAEKWVWNDLVCQAGHTIQLPQWLSQPGPHRGAIDLTRTGVQRPR